MTFTVNRTLADPVNRDFYLLSRSDGIRPKCAKKKESSFSVCSDDQMKVFVFVF